MMQIFDDAGNIISTHAPAGGATLPPQLMRVPALFLLTPLREGRRPAAAPVRDHSAYFYSRPCGRGDMERLALLGGIWISTHAPAGGATRLRQIDFGLTETYFYSRPCGRGDEKPA